MATETPEAVTVDGFTPTPAAIAARRERIRRRLVKRGIGTTVGVSLGVLFLVLVALAANGRWNYLLAQAVAGLGLGAIAALSGVGLVLTYRATGVFNFAQGGVATLVAFVFFELNTYHSFPVLPAVIVSVLIVGPAIGVVLERIVFRPLERRAASTSEKLVANLGALVLLLGICYLIWQTDTFQPHPVFPSRAAFHLGNVSVGADTVGNVLIVVIVGIALGALFRYTMLGRRIRAVVDVRELAELNAVNANRVSAFSWALGCAFAGLAGVLYAPLRGLQAGYLTLTVLETIGVAVIAKLRSIPAAVGAGIALGMAQSLASALSSPHYPSWVPLGKLSSIYAVEIFVIATLVFLLVYRNLDEVGAVGSTAALVTGTFGRARRSGAASVAVPLMLSAVVALTPIVLNGDNALTAQKVIAYSIVFLSIVAITGYSGHITLAAAAFAGLGAYATARMENGYLPLPTGARIPHLPVLLAMVVAGLLVIPLGVAVGYPALRRKGLILGLVTLAFAQAVDKFIFQQPAWTYSGKEVVRPSLGPLSFQSDRAFLWLELAFLGLALLLVRNLRSGTLGRVLGAMRDSENGAVSVGISLRRYKLFIFGASAFVAAIGGSLIAQQAQALNLNFDGPFSPLSGLYYFAAVVVFGLSYRMGAILAAIVFVVTPVLTGQQGSSLFVVGLFAMFIGQLHGGIIGTLSRAMGGVRASLVHRVRAQSEPDIAPPTGTGLRPSSFATRVLTGSRQ